MELLVLLLVPLFAAAVLGFVGDRKFAPEINILGSAATFIAGLGLALKVYSTGPMLAGGKFFFVDRLKCLSLSAYFFCLDDNSDIQQKIHAAGKRAWPCRTLGHEVLPCHVPALYLRDAPLPADK